MSVGVVTQHLYELIAKQVDDHRLIVWYDPDQVYSAVVDEFELPNTIVACYNGSFFQLRHDIDSLMNREQPPRLVVRIPENRGSIHHVLIALEAAGAIIQPGQQPPTRNAHLAILAHNALKPILGDNTMLRLKSTPDSRDASTRDELSALPYSPGGSSGMPASIQTTISSISALERKGPCSGILPKFPTPRARERTRCVSLPGTPGSMARRPDRTASASC